MPVNNLLFYKTAHAVVGQKGLQSLLPAWYLCSRTGGRREGGGNERRRAWQINMRGESEELIVNQKQNTPLA